MGILTRVGSLQCEVIPQQKGAAAAVCASDSLRHDVDHVVQESKMTTVNENPECSAETDPGSISSPCFIAAAAPVCVCVRAPARQLERRLSACATLVLRKRWLLALEPATVFLPSLLPLSLLSLALCSAGVSVESGRAAPHLRPLPLSGTR